MFDMISNVIKSLFAGPATRLYPVEKREPFRGGRGQLVGIDPETCIYCGICQKKCPALAITVDKPMKTWKMDPFKCVICGVCVEACPKKCMTMDAQYRQPAYGKCVVELSKAVEEQPAELPQHDTEHAAARVAG